MWFSKHLSNSSGDVAIVIGAISPNSVDISSYGNLSKENTTKVNGDTVFDIASVTKTLTTLLLADMANCGEVNLHDALDKYLPSNVAILEYNGQKITLENLATHSSGLPDFPPNFE